MFNLTGASALEGNTENALGLLQMFGALPTQIAKETMDGTQAYIAGANFIAPTGFQTLQEGGDSFDAQLCHGELAGITFFLGRELQQQLQAVAVTLERMGTEGPLLRQVVGEEAVQCQSKGRGFGRLHARPPVVNRGAKRWWKR